MSRPIVSINTSATDDDRHQHYSSDDDDDHALHTFRSEIARMSQDTDAILDSIRRAAQTTPTVNRKHTLTTWMRNHHTAKEESLASHYQLDQDDDDDDDMTDDGSVPEEVRRKIQDELTMLDTKFSTDPDGVSEEIRRVSMESLSPLAAHDDDDDDDDDDWEMQDSKLAFMGTTQLMMQTVVVWTVVLMILVRVWRKGLLDENGVIALHFLLFSRTTAS